MLSLVVVCFKRSLYVQMLFLSVFRYVMFSQRAYFFLYTIPMCMVPRLQAREAKALARSADEEARRVERTVATQEEQVR